MLGTNKNFVGDLCMNFPFFEVRWLWVKINWKETLLSKVEAINGDLYLCSVKCYDFYFGICNFRNRKIMIDSKLSGSFSEDHFIINKYFKNWLTTKTVTRRWYCRRNSDITSGSSQIIWNVGKEYSERRYYSIHKKKTEKCSSYYQPAPSTIWWYSYVSVIIFLIDCIFLAFRRHCESRSIVCGFSEISWHSIKNALSLLFLTYSVTTIFQNQFDNFRFGRYFLLLSFKNHKWIGFFSNEKHN